MIINTDNVWAMRLVGGADLTNGCSVIRNVLWRSLLALGGAAVIAFVLVAVAFTLAGTAIWLWSPWFGHPYDIELSLSFLGNSEWADHTRAGAFLGVILLHIGMVVAVLKGIFMAVEPVGNFLNKKRKVKVNPTFVAGIQRLTTPFVITGQALYNVAHKICPRVTLVLPEHVQHMMDHYCDYIINLPDSEHRHYSARNRGLVPWIVKKVKGGDGRITFYCESQDDDGYMRTEFFYYKFGNTSFNEEVVLNKVEKLETLG